MSAIEQLSESRKSMKEALHYMDRALSMLDAAPAPATGGIAEVRKDPTDWYRIHIGGFRIENLFCTEELAQSQADIINAAVAHAAGPCVRGGVVRVAYRLVDYGNGHMIFACAEGEPNFDTYQRDEGYTIISLPVPKGGA